ncbi:acyl-CoA dehydrogenase family protein [Sporosarcina sp. CAU 1771]
MITLSSDQIAIRSKAYDFAREALLPNEEKWEANGTFPYDAFQQTARAGYTGLLNSKELGGQGYSFLETALIYESLARGSFGFTFALGVHNVVGFGLSQSNTENEEMKRKITEISSGKKIAAIALTEPGAGSDPSSIESNAYLHNDGYVINGTKNWVTNGKEADYFAVVVKDKDDPTKTLMLLVDKTDAGLEILDSPKKFGANFISTPAIKFNDCFIPKDRLISETGLSSALQTIDVARLYIAAHSIGLTQQTIESAIQYLGGRIQFGRPIIKNQGIQWILADLLTELEAARWLTYHAASLIDQGKISSYKIAMAKLKAADLAMKATVECSQLFGANGLLQSYPMERYMKYAKISQIVDGTSEIQKLIIGRKIEKEALKSQPIL